MKECKNLDIKSKEKLLSKQVGRGDYLIEEKMQQMLSKFGSEAKLLMLEILMLKDSLNRHITTRYIPIPEWNLYHTYPSVSSLRNYIANAAKNGFDEVIFRKGKRVFGQRLFG